MNLRRACIYPLLLSGAIVIALLQACQSAPQRAAYNWRLPPGFPPPPSSEETPLDAARVTLGRYLFYDRRLSANNTQACASCHKQELAFTDGRAHAVGSTGMQHAHNTLSLFNTGYLTGYTWTDPSIKTLEQQIAIPMFGNAPIELGITGHEAEVLARFSSDPNYKRLFAAAYPNAETVTWDHVIAALAAFTRSLVAGDSAYDRYVYHGDEAALSTEAQRGMRLFFSNELGCANCHTDIQPPDSSQPPRFDLLSFQDTGMVDAGPFRVPPLRNVAVTAPYMHDGSLATLEDVIHFYEAGGGAGRTRPQKNSLVDGFALSDDERHSLIAFLQSLTDEGALHDPRYSDPFRY